MRRTETSSHPANREKKPAKQKGFFMFGDVSPSSDKGSLRYPDPMESIRAVRSGLPGSSVKLLAETLSLQMAELYAVLHVSSRSVQRMMKHETLSIDTSDRLMRLYKVFVRTTEVFGEPEKATRWLKTPNYSLGDQTPLSLLDTTDGFELVLDSLQKIEYGVFG